MNIQWYPGHMAKTTRLLKESLSMVDVVIELLDARIPISSKNPDIDGLAGNKHRLIVMNKSDLADENVTKKWAEYYKERGFSVVLLNSLKSTGFNQVTTVVYEMMAEKIERKKAKGRIFVPVRAMIVGVPNVGKSTLINKYVGKAITKTGDRPGVTRSKQWVKVKKDFELLDTPGILWPKFEDQNIAINLALTGAVKDDVTNQFELSLKLIEFLLDNNRKAITTRYDIELTESITPIEVLEKIGEFRQFKEKGGGVDTGRASIILLDEFRAGKLGRISLEFPENIKSDNDEENGIDKDE